MIGKQVKAKQLLDLGNLKDLFQQIDHPGTLIEASDTVPLSTLFIEIASEVAPKAWQVFISYLPTSGNDLDLIKLQQVYVEMSKELNSISPELIATINQLNNTILFGKYSILHKKVVYRYVWALPQYFEFEANDLAEWLQLLTYNLESSYEVIAAKVEPKKDSGS